MLNTSENYGGIARLFHWVIAVAVTGLFGLGLYMVELSYYEPAYKTYPALHKSIGILVAILMVLRLIWRLINITPQPLSIAPRSSREANKQKLEHAAASLVHFLLYALPFALFLSGYLISTADGRPIFVFDAIRVPAIFPPSKGLEDTAGLVHEIIAWSLAGFVVLHALAALKHHFINKDRTLLRMLLGPAPENKNKNEKQNTRKQKLRNSEQAEAPFDLGSAP
ncbi:cytochrome b [Kiloniella litopenaei]|uniref:cytochrome b n=1 Tax=Kiloniella litopenaei TaxID=1549748 RepID=UPI0009E60CA0|nr:cytochrome b [Kiloniella litopenaei]